MSSLLIVDDEIICRLGVTNLLDWRKYGFENVESVSNGEEALDIMKQRPIDLVITDIKMPVMSGIELIEMAIKEGVQSQFIVLSSFDDYSYVRKALKLGAIDYILKLDLNEEHMKTLLEKVNSKISDKIQVTEGKDTVSKNTVKRARKQFVKQLLFGQINIDENFEKKCKQVEVNCISNNYCVLMFELDINNTITSEGVIEVIEEILLDYEGSYVCNTGYNEISIIYNLNSINGDNQLIQHLAGRLHYIIKQYFNQSVDIYISKVIEGLDKVKLGYLQVFQARNLKSFVSDSVYVYYENVMKNRENRDCQSCELFIKRLELTYNSIGDETIESVFGEIFTFFNEAKYIETSQVRYFISSLVYITNQYFEKLGYSKHYLWNSGEQKYQTLQSIRSKEGLIKLLEFLYIKLKEAVNDLEANYIIRNAKKYLKEHYCEGVVIKEMAEELSISNTYLSMLFKKETGVTIKDYLTGLKLEKAKHLLRDTNQNISQISRVVGYDNEHYFSKIFKQKVGITPSNFRNLQKNK